MKHIEDWYKDYIKSKTYDIYQAYKKPSIFKLNAFYNCKKEIRHMKIISYNTSFFTVGGYITRCGIDYFIVKTGRNTYYCSVDLLNL